MRELSAAEEARTLLAMQIEDAYETLRRLPDKDRSRLRTQMTHLPMQYEPEKMDPGAWRGLKMTMPLPQGREISRMEEALDWMSWLGRNYREAARAIYLVDVRHIPVVTIARVLHCSRGSVYNWRRAGLDRIVAHISRKEDAAA